MYIRHRACAAGVSCGNPLRRQSFFLRLWGIPLRHPVATSFSETDSRGLPLGDCFWGSSRGLSLRECLSGVSLDRFSGRNSGFLGPDHPRLNFPGVPQSSLHDFFSPLFLASLQSRSETPLFRVWHRKTSQNGGQNRPKSSPLGVRNRCYVARAEM